MLLPSIFNDNVFDDFMDGFDSFMDRSALYGKHGKNLMKTDVRDVGDHYELDMDLPGFKKDEIHAELENGYLTISAEKSLDKDEKRTRQAIISAANGASAVRAVLSSSVTV